MERRLVRDTGIPCFLFPMAPPTSPRGLSLLALATLRSLFVILRNRPLVTFATGGYVSVPAALASCLLRVPLVLFLPDVVPGRAVAWLVPMARAVAVSAEAARRYLPREKTVVTGYPVRESFEHASRAAGRRLFDIPDGEVVLCVFGGSQGSRNINEALAPCLPGLLSRYHVIHICGAERYEEARAAAASLPATAVRRYHLYPYVQEQEMAAALAAADLAVCRSGASVLGELPMTGTPAVLVPLPIPTVHQDENARYLAEGGAAVVLVDDELRDRLGPMLDELLSDGPRLARMATACRAMARPRAAQEIASLVRTVMSHEL